MNLKDLPQFLQNLLNQVIEQSNFNSYSIEAKSGAEPGDGFSCEVISVIIADRESDKKLNILCKVAPFDEIQRKDFLSHILFNREALFYHKLLPIFEKFQEDKNVPKDNRFLSYPKCYATIADDKLEHYAVLMDDLRTQGFKLGDKRKISPIENMRLAMKELGKFHGVSVAMKDQRPNEFAQFKEVSDIVTIFTKSENMIKTFDNFFDRTIKALKNETHKHIMRDIKVNFQTYLEYMVKNDRTDKFGVLSHGDARNTNFLYRLNEKGIAEDVRIIDWATIRYVSLAIDLVYCIFGSTDKALRDKEYENLLKLYYETLSKTLKLLGSNPNELFTFEDFQDEMMTCGVYALLKGPVILQITLADLPDESGEQSFNAGLSKKSQLEFERRINGILEDIVRLGYHKKMFQRYGKRL